MGWGGRWEGGSEWGTKVHPWLIHVNVWQKPSQYCKVISLQLNEFEKNMTHIYSGILLSHKRNKIGSFVETWIHLESVT